MVDTQGLVHQNLRLAQELKDRIDQLAAIGTVAAAVSQSLDLDLTLSTALNAVLDVVGAQAGGISLIDEASGEVVLRAQQGWRLDFVNPPMRVPVGQGMSGRVIASDNVLFENDFTEAEHLAVPSFHEEHFRSIAMAPMHARGKIIGILSIMGSQPNTIPHEAVSVLRAIADTVGVALDNARLYEASVEDEMRLSAVLQSSTDGIIATDQSGRIQLINHSAEQLLTIRAAQCIGQPLREVDIHPSIRSSLLFALSSRTRDANKVFQVTLDDGHSLSVQVAPVYVDRQIDTSGDTDGWVIVLQDVTMLRQAEAARMQFIQAAAHDMRNPLGVALNSLDLLRRMVNGDEDMHEIIGLATSGVSRIQDMLDNLLKLEHIESGYGFQLTEVPLGEIIEEVTAEMRPRFDSRGIAFFVGMPRASLSLQVDRKWVVRAILNYLDNAVKYSSPGAQVRLRVFLKEPLLYVEVVDDGVGVPVEAQTRLFERFYRADNTGDIPGTGLGLAIVKSVAEAHGGSVYYLTRPGHGSVFGLTLLLTH